MIGQYSGFVKNSMHIKLEMEFSLDFDSSF